MTDCQLRLRDKYATRHVTAPWKRVSDNPHHDGQGRVMNIPNKFQSVAFGLAKCPRAKLGSSFRPQLPHVNHAPDAVARLHVFKCLVDVGERLPVGNEFIHLQLALHVIIDKAGELSPAFDAAKRAAPPHTPRHQLECYTLESA